MPQQTVALDIGSYSIKLIQGTSGKNVAIERTAEVPNTLGLPMPVDEPSTEKFVELINNVFNDHSLSKNDVRLSLPESLVSTKIISIPPLSDAELASAISWQAEQHIPIPIEDLALEYQVIYRPDKNDKEGQMHVLLIGARKGIIDKYTDVFLRAEIEPTILETHTLSLYRSLQFTPEDPTTVVVHMGNTSTEMAVVDGGELRFVYTHTNAGQLLTRTLEQPLQLDAQQAEQYKRTYGIDATQLQGKMREVLLPAIRISILEIQKTIQFYASQNPSGGVKRILLSGGTAQLPGLVEYVTDELGAEVLIASPFATATGAIPPTNHPIYTVCMGLMMREVGS